MALLKTEELEPGMVLEREVVNLDGQILFASGATLNDRQISILKSWGVDRVQIEGGQSRDLPLDQQFSESVLEEAGRTVDFLFQHTDPKHPIIQDLRHICLKRKATKLQRHAEEPYDDDAS
ncbi:MAG: hypothetical protein EA425_03625 [Puniceicoccaceae bacterium]|nr:MAG: hypothetical protein EA425_03625 [Puniceicoccaceae bacterium]